MQLGGVRRQSAKLERKVVEDRRAKRLVAGDQRPECRLRQRVGHGRIDRHGCRRPRRAVEQDELPEDLAGTERDEDRLFAVLRFDRDLGSTRRDDVHRIARVALVEDRLAGPKPSLAQHRREAFEVIAGNAAEQPGARDGLDDRRILDSRRAGSLAVGHRGPLQPIRAFVGRLECRVLPVSGRAGRVRAAGGSIGVSSLLAASVPRWSTPRSRRPCRPAPRYPYRMRGRAFPGPFGGLVACARGRLGRGAGLLLRHVSFVHFGRLL